VHFEVIELERKSFEKIRIINNVGYCKCTEIHCINL